MRSHSAAQAKLFAVSLILGPLLFAVSSFFWVDGQFGVTGSTLLIFGSVFWILAFVGVFGSLEQRMPRYAAWGLLFAVYGAVCGGAAFAFQGLFDALYEIPHQTALEALGAHPVVANAIFWIGGPAFPLTLLVLGIVLARTKTSPAWAGYLLAAGGVLFPVARIPRIPAFAHLVDLAMLIPAWYLAARFLNVRETEGHSAGAARRSTAVRN